MGYGKKRSYGTKKKPKRITKVKVKKPKTTMRKGK